MGAKNKSNDIKSVSAVNFQNQNLFRHDAVF